jgi:hypothetical protein
MGQKTEMFANSVSRTPKWSVNTYSWGIYPNLSKTTETMEGYRGSNLILGECNEKIGPRVVLVSLLIADSSQVHHASVTVYSNIHSYFVVLFLPIYFLP